MVYCLCVLVMNHTSSDVLFVFISDAGILFPNCAAQRTVDGATQCPMAEVETTEPSVWATHM